MRTIPVMCLVGALVFSACGGDDDEPGAGGSSSPFDQADQAAEAADAADAAGNDGGNSGGASVDPPDACTLLTEAEVAQVVPGATSSGDSASSDQMSSSVCNWDNDTHQLSLTLNAGLPVEQMQPMIEAQVEDTQGEWVDVGADEDAALFSAGATAIELQVLDSDLHVLLHLRGDGAADQKSALTDLATAVVGRIG
jgi:hypothetical protein